MLVDAYYCEDRQALIFLTVLSPNVSEYKRLTVAFVREAFVPPPVVISGPVTRCNGCYCFDLQLRFPVGDYSSDTLLIRKNLIKEFLEENF